MIDGATCSRDEATAVTTCTRCGDFLCRGCVQQVPGSPLRYCAECLARRGDHLKGLKLGFLDRNKPARVSVAFGILGLCAAVVPFFVIGLPMAIWGLVEAKQLRGEGGATAVLGLLLHLALGSLWIFVWGPDWVATLTGG